jgi:hypothetical protein
MVIKRSAGARLEMANLSVLFLLQAATHFKGSSTQHSQPWDGLPCRPLFWSNSNQRPCKGGTMMPFPAGG